MKYVYLDVDIAIERFSKEIEKHKKDGRDDLIPGLKETVRILKGIGNKQRKKREKRIADAIKRGYLYAGIVYDYRKSIGWSAHRLAKVIYYTGEAVYKWENGISHPREDAVDAMRKSLPGFKEFEKEWMDKHGYERT